MEHNRLNRDEATESRGPARPESLSVELTESENSITIVKRRGAGRGGLFLLLWLIGWTVACVVLVGMVWKERTLFSVMFALPFWIAWFAVAGFLAWQRFGKEMFQLDDRGVYFERYLWIRIHSREVPRKEILSFRQCQSVHTENDVYLYGIEVETLGKPLRVLFDLPDNERVWIVYRLSRLLGANQNLESEVSVFFASPEVENSDFANAVLTESNTLKDPPSDCRWLFERDSQAMRFVRYGRIDWGSLLGLLFASLFWNGIVSVFLLSLFGLGPEEDGPVGAEWWGIFVFLIPFVVIGLAMIGGVLYNLLEPLHSTVWEIGRSSITRSSSWPFVRFTKEREIDSLDRLEMKAEEGGLKANQFLPQAKTSGTHYALILIDSGNKECCTIDNLTQGECRWIAFRIFAERPKWFKN